MARLKFCFVHGFLGKPKDWDPLIAELTRLNPEGFEFITYDIWRDLDRLPQNSSMEDWGQRFVNVIGDGPYTMVGYSLGGRLLLHGPWTISPKIEKLILISSKISLIPETQRARRLNADDIWSQKFLNEPWEKVMHDWESQEIFKKDSVRPLRRESEFSRVSLARTLTDWSLGHQRLNLQGLKSWKFPVLCIHGKEDVSQLPQKPIINDLGRNWSLAEVSGGHSPQFSHPSEVAVVINKFVR
ncbi:MAG: alpha/beta fold hydrolase [Bdellovibrionales bacterium]|nr:alpha/beta fold hydrolase [Bdellovibrionales bacterium]